MLPCREERDLVKFEIQALRKKQGLTQEKLAEKLGLTRGQLSMYEIGKREPDLATLRKFASFFGVTLDDLVNRETGALFEGPSLASPANRVNRQPCPMGGADYEALSPGPIREIPIVAEIPCGLPSLTEEYRLGSQPVDTSLVNLGGGEHVWLRAKGDSMIGIGIVPGTLVLIRLQPEVENGEIAAVSIDGENATLKRVLFGPGTITLKPENPTMEAVVYDPSRVRIVGKAIKLLGDVK